MKYIDGYILAVPKNKMKEYISMAKLGAKTWKKHGALEYFESLEDDLNIKWAGIKFPKTVRAKPGEKVIFSFVVFKSRKHRDIVNAKVMKDPVMNNTKYKDKPMPFDMKRMVYGGFKSFAEA